MPLIPSDSGRPAPRERRDSFRCPVTGPRQHGKLRIAGRTITARILDESTGGLAVESDEDPDCQIGDTLLVEVGSAWIEARVMHIARTEQASADCPGPDNSTPTRISLLRIRDVDEYEANPDDRPVLAWSRIRSGLTPLVAVGRTCRGTGTMVVVILAGGIVLVWALEHSVPLTQAIQRGAHDAAARAPDGDPPFVPELKSNQPRKKAAAPAAPPLEVKTAETSRPGQVKSAQSPAPPKPTVEVPQQPARWAHPNFLLKPEVARLLSLRREQRDQLQKLHQEHLAATGVQSARDGDDSLLDLHQKSLEVLTAEQRTLLTTLQAAMESSGGMNPTGEPSTADDEAPAPSEQPADRTAP